MAERGPISIETDNDREELRLAQTLALLMLSERLSNPRHDAEAKSFPHGGECRAVAKKLLVQYMRRPGTSEPGA